MGKADRPAGLELPDRRLLQHQPFPIFQGHHPALHPGDLVGVQNQAARADQKLGLAVQQQGHGLKAQPGPDAVVGGVEQQGLLLRLNVVDIIGTERVLNGQNGIPRVAGEPARNSPS